MNVITGLFVQSSLETAERDKDDVITLHQAQKETYLNDLHELFREWDQDFDGDLTLAEFSRYLGEAKVVAWLEALDVHVSDPWTLFKLIDVDGRGWINLDSFVEGMIKLKGSAKSIQMHEIMYQTKWLMSRFAETSQIIQLGFERVLAVLEVKETSPEDVASADSFSSASKATDPRIEAV